MKIRMTVAHLATLAATIATTGVACSGKTLPYAGGLMIAVQTDLVAPKDVAAVGLYISSDGKPIFGDTRDVAPNGEVKFPATIAVLGDENRPKAIIKIRVVAFAQDGKVRVMRDALTTVPRGRTGLLRVPLRWINEGSGTGMRSDLVQSASLRVLDATSDGFSKLQSTCAVDQTTIDHACVDAHVDGESLPDYHDADIFGGGSADGMGGTCFDVKACFASSNAVVLDDASNCTTSLHDGHDPNDPNLSLAVALKQDPGGPDKSTGECLGNGACLIVLDKGAEWTVEGSTIHFPKGLCARMRDAGAQGLVASYGCASKTDAAPACGPASAVATPGPSMIIPSDGGIVPPDAGLADFETPDLPVSEFAPNAVVVVGSEIIVARAGVLNPTKQPAGLWGFTYASDGSPPASQNRWTPMVTPASTPAYQMAVTAAGGDVILADVNNARVIDCPTLGIGPWTPDCLDKPLIAAGDGAAVTASSTRMYIAAAPGGSSPIEALDFGVTTFAQYLLMPATLPTTRVSALASAPGAATTEYIYLGYADGSIFRCDAPCDMGGPAEQLAPPSARAILAIAVLQDPASSRNWVYWLSASGVFRVENPYAAGAAPAATQLASPKEVAAQPALAVDSRYVYWGSGAAVAFRARDSASSTTLLGLLPSPSDGSPIMGITTTKSRVHWVTSGSSGVNGSVISARKKGSF